MISKFVSYIVGTVLLVASLNVFAEPASITVDVAKPTHQIPSTLWGIFFEDINLSADGGLYPERVRNRSFEDAATPEFWSISGGEAGIDTNRPLNSFNRRSLRVALDGTATLVNQGYWGMNIVKGDDYTFKLAARADSFTGPLQVKVLGANGRELAAGKITDLGEDWEYHTLDLIASGSDPKAELQITADGKGALYLDMVSLMPKKTWKNHGARIDLANAMAALKPGFFRFPGGSWVEGDTLDTMYHWKATIGDEDCRTPLWNLWGYYSTQGLGYYEYLQLAEDLHAEPVFCINVGMAHKDTVPMSRMGQWVQDALDAIQYANGPTNSVWGGYRARAGHPAQFHLKYMEIGNEDGGPAYNKRWPLFYQAIKAKYPGVKLIANEWKGNVPQTPKPDIVDEHYYNSPEWFMSQANHYDDYDRNGPKIFVGEYAATRKCGKGNLRAAIGEAAFMTGIERNSDIVSMACYAPLLVNVNHRQWNPDLINFDSAHWYGTPSYYVQKMFAENRGDVALTTKVVTGDVPVNPPTGGIGVGTWNTAAEFKDIKVTAPDGNVLFQSDFSHHPDSNAWTFIGDGNWRVVDGTLRQTVEKPNIRAILNDKNWTNYTVGLKARKLCGAEGFLTLFHLRDVEGRTGWNLGGWGNTLYRVDLGGSFDQKSGHIETGRWYDIKIALRGWNVKCWLDGKLIHDVTNTLTTTHNIYANAVQDDKSGDIILKVVNAAAAPTDVEINLVGAKHLASTGTATVLTSDNPEAENSLAAPKNISPHTERIILPGASFTREFPANSLTVFRFSLKE